ncbi:MAG TPA: NAD(P)/FAD-dependent oxidoreductase [Candidatus Corynebacterium avicola]|uniref:NAD(P)/FAD-dependent oxidoreductase n=1 Tax=Candidatus Corynebacterium avicola TaxID=2838527 RepID=A0A9D1RQY1_9CORY|nr:NAD(P)/FAD-dependent oxidoreductase [Candidatus Corynebacterium avicola]
MDGEPRAVRALVVGAGQAGLAAAHELVRRGFTPGEDFLVLDGNDGPGGAWRHRWDSLTLGRAHGIADLPGMPMERPDPSVPAATLVADYYRAYEERFGLEVVRPASVIRVESEGGDGNGLLRVTALVGERCTTIHTSLLLNATGTWTHPHIPYVPGIADFTGRQLHTVDYVRKEDFTGQRVLVVGGGMSAVQFLLELNEPGGAESTVWATRRPPNFTPEVFDERWGLDVERRVRQDTMQGRRPQSVVTNTGIPPWPEYLQGIADGVLVSRGMISQINEHDAVWGLDSASDYDPDTTALAQPDSWSPFPAGHTEEIDVIFWNTGFRPALTHLSPLHLREPGGGITMSDEVTVAKDPRVLLVGYGSTASTIGANRAGRLAGRAAARLLGE